MGLRIVRGVTLAVAIASGFAAWGAEAAEPASPAPHGAVVVALDEASTAAAKPLTRAVYADPTLRPSIDEVTARALIGEPLGQAPSAAASELAELRASIPRAGSEAAARKLLAAIGSDLHAVAVIAVSSDENRTVARVVRVAGALDQNVEIVATRSEGLDGAIVFAWPNAVTTIRALVAEPALVPLKTSAPPLTSATAPAPEAPAFWTSPWFWAPLGGLLVAGVTVFAASKATSPSDSVHVTGSVSP